MEIGNNKSLTFQLSYYIHIIQDAKTITIKSQKKHFHPLIHPSENKSIKVLSWRGKNIA